MKEKLPFSEFPQTFFYGEKTCCKVNKKIDCEFFCCIPIRKGTRNHNNHNIINNNNNNNKCVEMII